MSRIAVTIDGHTYEVDLNLGARPDAESTVLVNGEPVQVAVPGLAPTGQFEWIVVNNRPYEVVLDEDLHWIKAYGGLHRLEVHDLEATVSRPVSGDTRVKAPIPGLITRVLVNLGDRVEAGQSLLVLVAMKMENEIRAPRSGSVTALNASPGKDVTLNEVLAEIG
jgi:biotin carboxyl carrier protein